jgi:hypothetical protein
MILATKKKSQGRPGGNDRKSVAIYHLVHTHESFETAAGMLLELVRSAAREQPGRPRTLYLDIEGHRNTEGGFDGDMFELQKEFILGYLSRWLSEIHIPLFADSAVQMPGQEEDVPEKLLILPGGEQEDRTRTLRDQAAKFQRPVYDSATGEYVEPDGTRRKSVTPTGDQKTQ